MLLSCHGYSHMKPQDCKTTFFRENPKQEVGNEGINKTYMPLSRNLRIKLGIPHGNLFCAETKKQVCQTLPFYATKKSYLFNTDAAF